ncbi:MAG: hypothetical protein GY708_26775 [Actinomycetia bacterium]|nr:hypothetical protein [Actinomycetes bacterium]MCP4961362.1 hypothetical protein [Actinomycetes bacterium]
MDRIKNTIELAKVSWQVLMHDRELLWIPVLSMFASLGLLIVLAIPAFAMLDTSSSEESVSPGVAFVGLLAALGLSVIAVFFKGALVAAAHDRMTGGDPTVSNAISRATKHIAGLVPWALLTATVGLILQAIRERSGILGRIVTNIAGAAWEIVTFLVIPAIIIDDMGAIDGVKRSGQLLKRTWGENLAARVGFGLVGFAAAIPLILVVVLLAASGSTALLVVGIAIAVVGFALISVVLTALNAIFQTALYMYATTGETPTAFRGTSLAQSFVHK